MTDIKKTNQAMRVAVTAGAIGAAAGAVGVLMMDKKNQKMVSEKVDQIKKWSDKTVNDLKSKTDDAVDTASQQVDKLADKSEDLSKEVKKEAKDQSDTYHSSVS